MSTFLDDYMFYSSENECDPKFHKWAGLMTLSMAMSRKVWVQYSDWRISPNMYVFFVGPPAAGKSVAMELSEKVVQEFTEYVIAPNSVTAPSLVQTMAQKCGREFEHGGTVTKFSPISIFSDELTSLLGPEPTAMIDLLTALYSNGAIYRNHTKNKGNDDIERPCVTMICCLTPQFLNAMLTQKLISGGFTRRMTLVYCAQRGPAKPWPVMTEAHFAAKNRCIEYCRQLQKLVGPFELSPTAKDLFTDWYLNEKDPQMRDAEPVMAQYFSVKNIHLLKLSMLIAVSERIKPLIDLHHLEQALQMLEALEPDIMNILGAGGRNELAPVTREISRFIKEAGKPVSRRLIIMRFNNNAKTTDLDEILKVLLETKQIRLSMENGQPTYTWNESPV